MEVPWIHRGLIQKEKLVDQAACEHGFSTHAEYLTASWTAMKVICGVVRWIFFNEIFMSKKDKGYINCSTC